MKVVVVGGKLQGVEATYLAHKAGWEVILVDKNPAVPAAGICDVFYRLDITKDVSRFSHLIRDVDLVIPAVEDIVVLNKLKEQTIRRNIPFAYDAQAYMISSSKKNSNVFLRDLGIRIPSLFPDCKFPLIAKPSVSSGSRGVKKIKNREEFAFFLENIGYKLDDWVVQEFLEGPIYSLEVIGFNGNCRVFQITEVQVDCGYDSKRILAPIALPFPVKEEFQALTTKVAKSLSLTGIMDVEVIYNAGTLEVLEFDARLPSQTPTTVYHSTGINMVSFLYDIFVRNFLPELPEVVCEKGVVYEHVKISSGRLEVVGEHIIGEAGPLRHYHNFFGADEALTNFTPGKPSWVATLIIVAESLNKAWQKRCRVIKEIAEFFRLSTCDLFSESDSHRIAGVSV